MEWLTDSVSFQFEGFDVPGMGAIVGGALMAIAYFCSRFLARRARQNGVAKWRFRSVATLGALSVAAFGDVVTRMLESGSDAGLLAGWGVIAAVWETRPKQLPQEPEPPPINYVIGPASRAFERRS